MLAFTSIYGNLRKQPCIGVLESLLLNEREERGTNGKLTCSCTCVAISFFKEI